MFSIYRKSYFFIFRYSVAGFIFSNRAACSRCPLHICRALMMDSFSVFSSFNGNMTVTVIAPVKKRPFCMAVKTNLLYDAVLIPDIGVEFCLGKNWSVAGNWMYAWWKSDRKHNYWRIYGGDVELRRWFGRRAVEKPFSGHHVGLYGQIVTYDFELGGKGYLGDKWSYGGGVAYGYSLPVGHRFNVDFTLGIGYLGGSYKEYIPLDGHYVWQTTKNRRWFGPTKAGISLVWLIGRGNYSRKKGGRQ